MIASVSGIIALIFYLVGTILQSRNMTSAQITNTDGTQLATKHPMVLVAGAVAVCAHLVNVMVVIPVPNGYDFGFFKIATLFSWVISAIVLLSSLRKPVDNLFVALFPLAMISILCSLLFTSTAAPLTDIHWGVASHILLGILSVSIITIAAFQAVLVAWLNKLLKQKLSFRIISHLPPLQTMEALLFELVWAGLIMLTGVIVTGVLFMEDFFAQHLSHKTVLSLISWCVFAVLLWGRHQLGWRGRTALRWTLTGFVFLILAYFGSKFVLEIILDRP